jgi:hypothetical protein
MCVFSSSVLWRLLSYTRPFTWRHKNKFWVRSGDLAGHGPFEDTSCLIKTPHATDILHVNKRRLSTCLAVKVNQFCQHRRSWLFDTYPLTNFILYTKRMGTVKSGLHVKMNAIVARHVFSCSKWYLHLFSDQNFVCIFHFPHSSYIYHRYHPSWFNHSNNITGRM